ncbi:MAG: amidohydrolase family protein, partial [Bacteroidales bacterium]|nr:amidohydrolase family protein [Bacteroidales bacterium]
TANPARIMGLSAAKGSIAPGYDADIVIFDDNIDIYNTIIKGKEIYVKERI